MPKVSVNICCYNAERYLDETLCSVFEQTYNDWELIVVDDGSTDRTGDIVQTYVKQGLPIRYHRQANGGLGNARNTCISLSQGDWIALIDHDDLCLPHWLQTQVELAQRYPEVVLFFSNTEHFRDDGSIVRRKFDITDPCGWDLSSGKALDRLLIHGCFINTSSVLVKKEVVISVGGFGEGYRFITDYDLFLRVAACYSLYCDDRVLCRWRIHDQQASEVMTEVMLAEHIDLLNRWHGRFDISSEAQHAVVDHLYTYMLGYARFLFSQHRYGDAARYLLHATTLRPTRTPVDLSRWLCRSIGRSVDKFS